MAGQRSEDVYFLEQLTFLHEGGRALARAVPGVAGMLAEQGLDPDVERLLEGVAFIASKVRHKQDWSLTETCQLMFDVVFPGYLDHVPPAAIVQLEGGTPDPVTIPRGSAILSTPVMGTQCQFRTVYDVELSGLRCADVAWLQQGADAQLTLELTPDGEPAELPRPDRLRLHLHGEPLITRSLYKWLLRGPGEVMLLDGIGRTVARTDEVRAVPVGLDEQEAMLPAGLGTFEGFRLLQEYFTLRDKFLFVDLLGLGPLLAELPADARGFGLRLQLRADPGQSFMVTSQTVRLGCTPVVNLFPHTADPIRRDPGRDQYLVRPAGPYLHYAACRVEEVSGHSGDGSATAYPLVSELDWIDRARPFCQLSRRVVDDVEHFYLSLSDGGEQWGRQTVLVDLLCSNGLLPRGLQLGDINAPAAPCAGLRCRNITPVTPAAFAPDGHALHARLVSHLALAKRELASLDALRGAIELYDFHAAADPSARRSHGMLLEGLLELECETAQARHERIPIWGTEVTLTVDESALDTPAELYLLGTILDEYVAAQAPLNFFTRFGLRAARSQELLRWPRRVGSRRLE